MMVDGFYDGFNQSEKKDDNLVLEKEKENVKHDYKAQIEENVLLKDKLNKTSNSLKNSDKEASKALNKCENRVIQFPGSS
jgi:hypothetical protein